jgi:hypothetical protein
LSADQRASLDSLGWKEGPSEFATVRNLMFRSYVALVVALIAAIVVRGV